MALHETVTLQRGAMRGARARRVLPRSILRAQTSATICCASTSSGSSGTVRSKRSAAPPFDRLLSTVGLPSAADDVCGKREWGPAGNVICLSTAPPLMSYEAICGTRAVVPVVCGRIGALVGNRNGWRSDHENPSHDLPAATPESRSHCGGFACGGCCRRVGHVNDKRLGR